MKSLKRYCPVIVAILAVLPGNLGAVEAGGNHAKFLGKALPETLHHKDPYSIRDLFVEDVPGTKSYWLGPWVEKVVVNGVDLFYIIKGYDRFYVNAAHTSDSQLHFLLRSTGLYDFYGPFQGKPSDHFKLEDESGAGQSAIRSESDSEGGDKLQHGSEERSR